MPLKQENRPYEAFVPHLGDDVFVFMSMEGNEYVSHTFQFRVVLATTNASINDEDLLRKPMYVVMRREEGPDRYLHGIIQRAKLVGKSPEQEDVYYWEVIMVPWLWFLNLETECRHYQNLTAIEIITKVFESHSCPDFTFKTQGTFPKREFTVQYRETSFNFVSRLMEEEGIFYWFEHSNQKHQLILTNVNSATQDSPVASTLQFGKGNIAGSTEGQVDTLESATSIHTGKITLQDYDFEKSSVSLLASTKGKQLSEVYDYPGRYKTKADGERYAKLILEEQEARLRVIHAHTTVTTLQPGFRFKLTDHFDGKCNTTYIVLSVSCSARQNLQGPEAGDDRTTASFHFSAIPLKVPYRPPRRHPKPLIHGVQTAVVTGPAGNEIYCDKYGRVKVKFHWDRQQHKSPEESSFWIRVSSAWAGSQWGQISLPRIGQEVIVSFLEGDPDRPIITGRVYNDLQMPPYSLPDNMTQSGIKSRSTKGGGSEDFNEFRFEDKKGSEQIYLHAQKDFDEYIENKHTTTVRDSDQEITLEKGNQKTLIKAGNREITLNQGSTTHTMKMGNHKLECTAGKIEETAAQEIKMSVGSTVIKLTPTGIELQVGASKMSMTAMGAIEITGAACSIKHGPAMTSVTAPIIKLN
jgi:type VI secretion system secreted protein VgrG